MPRPARQRRDLDSLDQHVGGVGRERLDAKRGLFGFALWIVFETLMGIMRENTIHMTQLNKTIPRAALVALGLLMAPLVASQFVEDWHWGVGGFVFAYLMFFGTALAYGLIARTMGEWAYKAGLALVTGFVMGWTNMVHISESENPANFIYFGVLWVGGVGAWIARLEARGMAKSMFTMAMALALVSPVGVMLFPDVRSEPGQNLMLVRGVFVTLFAASGLLFRHASLAGSK